MCRSSERDGGKNEKMASQERFKMKPEPKTLSVPQAGRLYFEIGKNASYAAARKGQIPVIRIGKKIRVPIAALEKMLLDATPKKPLK